MGHKILKDSAISNCKDKIMKTVTLKIDPQTLSHELRIPLTGILGMAHLLELKNLNAEQKQEVDVIKEAGQRLLAFIDELLAHPNQIRHLKPRLAVARVKH